MTSLRLRTVVDAPVERVFDAARDVDRHTETMADHDERAVGGVTAGRLEAGDTVTWRASHFGVPFEMTVRITAVEAPHYFRDEQIEGPFESMRHDHHFHRIGDGRTGMVDEFRFASPFGPLGSIVDALLLRRYMWRVLVRRNCALTLMLE